MIGEIADVLEEMDKNDECRSIILYSEGKHFCAGADFTRSSMKEESDPYEKLYQQAVRLFRTKKPIIGVIQGAALEVGLAFLWHVILELPVLNQDLGKFCKVSFSSRLRDDNYVAKSCGHQKAALMLLTGRRITGDEALILD